MKKKSGHKKKNKSRKKRRKNPEGGFLPAVAGFFASGIATTLLARFASKLVAPGVADHVTRADVAERATVHEIVHVAAALLAWQGGPGLRDAGWRSFARGAMWGEIVSAIFTPVATVLAPGEFLFPDKPELLPSPRPVNAGGGDDQGGGELPPAGNPAFLLNGLRGAPRNPFI